MLIASPSTSAFFVFASCRHWQPNFLMNNRLRDTSDRLFFLSIDVRVLWIFRFIIISVVVYFLLFHEKPFLIQFFSWADLWSSRSLFCAPLCDFLIIPSSNLCWISNAQTCVYTAWRTALYNRSQMTFSDGDISTCGIFCKLTSAPPTNTHQLYYF